MGIVTTQAAGQGMKSILVVDDEDVIRDLCAKALKGYRIFQAGDGEEALRIFEMGGIDVVLTDVMMPKMNGIELLKRVKELEPTLVVIVMTGYAEKDIILNALKADADDFITKPLNLLQLKTAIDKALDKKALKEEIANLKSMDRLKSNFLSLISHKFRTPLTSISLFLQNQARGVFDPSDETVRTHTQLIFEQALYLESLVAELLAFSKFMDAGGTLKPVPFSLGELVNQLALEAQNSSGKKNIRTTFDLMPLAPVNLDREKIAFAIRQLLDNAFKFTADGGDVHVALSDGNDRCRIVIRDNGIGISREDQPKIFEKFYQVDADGAGQVRGFGLGLFYAREFVKLHGGSIAVDSEPGKGTAVTVTLPYTAEMEA